MTLGAESTGFLFSFFLGGEEGLMKVCNYDARPYKRLYWNCLSLWCYSSWIKWTGSPENEQ